MFVTLEEAKKHLNIEVTFTDDNNYIITLIEVAENAVEKHIDIKLTDIATEGVGGTLILPAPIRQAILLMVGTLYANRESITESNIKEVPNTFEYLLNRYRKITIQ